MLSHAFFEYFNNFFFAFLNCKEDRFKKYLNHRKRKLKWKKRKVFWNGNKVFKDFYLFFINHCLPRLDDWNINCPGYGLHVLGIYDFATEQKPSKIKRVKTDLFGHLQNKMIDLFDEIIFSDI